ncbi:MAG: bidirectional hydrogenase complex protein HoxU [Ancalomicrobiaceae bacterium]|nr:bidirectional hydrogenase complex protein HoxU [Ancalomicrobiaceae bacterium]
MSSQITVRIDGVLCTATEGETIFEVAEANGKHIPSLCHMEGVSSAGSCRLCLVEVAGIDRLLPACTTPAQRGMAVTTTSDRLSSHRRLALELMFVERNHICAVCVSNGHCELQALAQSLGVTHVRYPYNSPRLSVDVSHPRFVLDHNRCILCSRCVRVCDEIEGAHVWDIGGRGIGSRVVADLDRPWGESQACTACGKCVQVCPTGALVEKGYAVEEMTRSKAAIARLAVKKGATP